jgi:hypothetical protein
VKIMLRPATPIRYHITAILAAHWVQFVAQYLDQAIGAGVLEYWNDARLGQ